MAQNEIVEAAALSHRLDTAAAEYNSQMWRAMAHQSRAALMAGQGDVTNAIRNYEKAHQDFLEAGNQYEATRCQSALAALRS